MIRVALTDRLYLVSFIFPGYQVLSRSLAYRAEKGLYYLQESESVDDVLEYFTAWCDETVVVTTRPLYGCDLDLSKRDVSVKTLGEERKIRTTQRALRFAASAEDAEFDTFLKVSSLLKKWTFPERERREPIYRIFEALANSEVAFFETYYKVRRRSSSEVLFSSLLTFIDKVCSFKPEADTDYYSKVILSNKNIRGKVVPAVNRLVAMPPDVPLDWKILQFCLWLRGKGSL